MIMFMMNKNIVTNLQYHRVLVMWKMILLALLLLTVSCKSQKTITRNIASQTIICGKCQGSGEERFCPKCAGTGQVIPNSKGGPDRAVGICPICHGSGRAFVRPCELCNGTGEISIANTSPK